MRYDFISDFLSFGEILQIFYRSLNPVGNEFCVMKNVGFVTAVFFNIFPDLCLLALRKNWSDRFPCKTSSKVKNLLLICQSCVMNCGSG